MRLSTFRLWISAGLSLLVVEFILFIGFAIWTKSELTRMEREVLSRASKWKEENSRLSREMRTVNKKLRDRTTGTYTGTPDDELYLPGDTPVSIEIQPADLIRQFRDAILMEDKEGENRSTEALRGMGRRAANALIIAIPSVPSGFMKGHLFRLLGTIPGGGSFGFLQSQFGSQTDKAVQLAILDGLILQPDSSSLPLLKTALAGEQKEMVRGKIFEAIKSIGTDEAARVLMIEFGGGSAGERTKIMNVMVGMKAAPLEGFFDNLLRTSDNASFRIMSIRGLVDIGASAVIPLLESVRDSDPDEKVKLEAESAIEKLQG